MVVAHCRQILVSRALEKYDVSAPIRSDRLRVAKSITCLRNDPSANGCVLTAIMPKTRDDDGCELRQVRVITTIFSMRPWQRSGARRVRSQGSWG
jgi:hypothetical protein